MISPIKKLIIEEIIDREGGYINDPSDSGGETNFGITVEVARAHGYTGPMKFLPRQTAFNIYAETYWDSLQLDYIEQKSPILAAELADTAVNMGIARAGEFLQRCLNALNDCQKYYPDLKVDGKVGMKTISNFYSYLTARGVKAESVMLKALNCLQGAFYIELCEKREKDEKFLVGWLENRVILNSERKP